MEHISCDHNELKVINLAASYFYILKQQEIFTKNTKLSTWVQRVFSKWLHVYLWSAIIERSRAEKFKLALKL